MSHTFACHNCDGTGYVYTGEGSMLDEDNYDLCVLCDGYGFLEEVDPRDEVE